MFFVCYLILWYFSYRIDHKNKQKRRGKMKDIIDRRALYFIDVDYFEDIRVKAQRLEILGFNVGKQVLKTINPTKCNSMMEKKIALIAFEKPTSIEDFFGMSKYMNICIPDLQTFFDFLLSKRIDFSIVLPWLWIKSSGTLRTVVLYEKRIFLQEISSFFFDPGVLFVVSPQKIKNLALT